MEDARRKRRGVALDARPESSPVSAADDPRPKDSRRIDRGDRRGVSRRAFDGAGNYTLGLKEQIIFPEIDYDRIDVIKGLNISFVTTAKTDEEGRALLQAMGMPFRAA